MSNLDRLIAELCPDGVEHKALEEIAIDRFGSLGQNESERPVIAAAARGPTPRKHQNRAMAGSQPLSDSRRS